MDYKHAYQMLFSSIVFKKWKNKQYLSHLFGEIDEQLHVVQWQIGYYDKKLDKVTTFVIGDHIERMPAEEVFKKEGIVEELELDNVKIGETEALEAALALQKKKYPQHPVLKGIIILQQLDKVMWNVTFITRTFAALNVKVDALNGSIVHDSLNTFFDMATPQ